MSIQVGGRALRGCHCAKPSTFWVLLELFEAAEKASHWLWIMRDKLITAGRITGVRGYEVERPENPSDLWCYH